MQSRSTEIDSTFWGQYSDLYNTLEASEVELLEKAILARRLGRFKEARDIHDSKLPQSRLVPVLALERANLASRLGLAGDQYAILQEALSSAGEWRHPGSPGETTLLEISIVEARFEWTGGVKIACTSKYFNIMKQCRLYSNWIDLHVDAVFLVFRGADPWSGLESVIRVANTQGKLFTCLELIRLYIEFLDEDEKLKVFSNFVHECEIECVSGSQQSSLVLICSRLWYVEMLQDLSKVGEVPDELSKVRNQLSTSPWIQNKDTPNLLLQKLLIVSKTSDDFAFAASLSDLATMVSITEDRLLETGLLAKAMTSLNQITHSRRCQTWYDLNGRLVTRYSELHANHQSRAVLKAGRISRLAFTIGTVEDQSKSREYLVEFNRFEKMHPEFDVPTSLYGFYHGAAVASRRLGNKDEARVFEDKKVLALHDCPVDPSQFFRIYRGRPSGEWAPHLLNIILTWIKADLAANKLSANQVELMLNTTVSEFSSEVASYQDQILEVLESPGEALVGRIFGSPTPVSCEAWETTLKRFDGWLWDSPSNVDRYIRHTILGDLQQARCVSVQNYVLQVINKGADLLNRDLAKLRKEDLIDINDEDLLLDVRIMKRTEYTRLLNLRNRLDQKAMGTDEDTAFSDKWSIMCEYSQLAGSIKAFRTGLIQDDDLAEAQTWFEEAYSQLNSNNPVRKLATLQQISSCQMQRYIMFGTVAADAPLKTYELYDEVYTEQRIVRSILRGTESVTARIEMVSRWSFTNHYDFAMATCVEAIGVGQRRNNYHRHIVQDMHHTPTAAPPPNRSMKTLFTNLIDWAQKKKARSVTEAIGAEVIVSRNVLSEVSTNDEAVNLLKREADVQNKINNANGEVLKLSRDLDLIRQEMRTCSSLKKLMDLRDGQALTESQIESLTAELGENVVIVDFVYLATSFTGIFNEILPMVYKKGRLVNASWVTAELRHTRVRAWMDAYLDQKKPLSDDEPVLSHLYPLIEAGVKFSNPGDLIVLCPTDILFTIPLHAIELPDGTPWIKRNPIVYTQALSVLRLCHYAASASGHSTNIEPLAFQALSADDLARAGVADMAFASRCNARILQGEALTKQSFLNACAESKLINFYGHVCFDPERPLDHHLAIRGLEAERVTVRDIFDLRLQPGTHINLIGCQSARSKVGINDDQLGLSTALFFAGAASMVTTLWSIDMTDGDAFQEAFFDELLAQSEYSESGIQQEGDYVPGIERHHSFLDLAKALQAAILRLSIDDTGRRRPPYHWAAFTLQGCWNKMPLLNVSDESKGESLGIETEIIEGVSKMNIKP